MVLILGAACMAQAQLTPTNPPANVVLAWDPPASNGVAGYNVYWGPGARFYTNVLSTTNLTARITGLERGVTYYFAATAVSVTGLESEFSNEVSYATPARPTAPVLRLGRVKGWQLQGRGEPYQMYLVQRTTDLAAWATISTVTADRHGAFVADDVGAAAVAAFYRTAL